VAELQVRHAEDTDYGEWLEITVGEVTVRVWGCGCCPLEITAGEPPTIHGDWKPIKVDTSDAEEKPPGVTVSQETSPVVCEHGVYKWMCIRGCKDKPDGHPATGADEGGGSGG
jgi:hypothetical protein